MQDSLALFEIITKFFQVLGNSPISLSILALASLSLGLLNRKNLKFNFFDYLVAVFFLVLIFSFSARKAPFGYNFVISFFSFYSLFKIFQIYKPYSKKIVQFFLVFLSVSNLLALVNFVLIDPDRFSGFTNFNQTIISYPNFWALITGVGLLLSLKLDSTKYVIFQRLILSCAFFLTQSRTSILILFVVLGWYLANSFLNKNIKKSISYISIIITGSLLASIIVFSQGNIQNIEDRFTNQSIESKSSFDQRFDFFKDSIEMGMDNPFLGVGPDNFQHIQAKYSDDFYTLSSHPHNLFLKLFSENGIFAVIVVLVGIFYLMHQNKKNLSDPSFLAFLFILGQSQFDYNLQFSLSIIISAFVFSRLTTQNLKPSIHNQSQFLYFCLLGFFLVSTFLVPRFTQNKFYWLESSKGELSTKYPQYYEFSTFKAVNLTPVNNLEVHHQYILSNHSFDKVFYKELLFDVLKKIQINYNFLVLDEVQVVSAFKISCLLEEYDLFDQLKLAYLTELSKLDLTETYKKYENITCNSKSW